MIPRSAFKFKFLFDMYFRLDWQQMRNITYQWSCIFEIFVINNDWLSNQRISFSSDHMNVRFSNWFVSFNSWNILEYENHTKNILLISLLIISLFGCIYGFYRQYQIQDNMNLMLKEFEILQKAENNILPTSRKSG